MVRTVPACRVDDDSVSRTAARADWVRLSKTGASARRLNSLLAQFGSPEALFARSPAQLAAEAGFSLEVAGRILDPRLVPQAGELEQLDSLGVRLLVREDAGYPRMLAEIADPPPLLYVLGELVEADACCVAVVGSRRATAYGRGAAERLSRELAAAGVTVVSGLALGIDAHAHRGSLAGGGRTLAVKGCGVDVPYPWANRELAAQIARSGALISEYPLGAAPDAWHFPSRNRIVSGLSLGVVVVEAGKTSGALITAACAVDQNREVFAVPGRIDSPLSDGPHALLRDGARLVQTVEDILEELRLGAGPPQPELPLAMPELSEEERTVLALLTPQAKHIDDLILESDLPAAQMSAALMMLEIKGAAVRSPGNYFTRR